MDLPDSIWYFVVSTFIIIAVGYAFGFVTGPAIGTCVPWREYLPNGLVYSFLTDARKSATALAKLSKKYGDTLLIWLGPRRTVICGHPSDVAQILASTSQFSRPTCMRYVLQTAVPDSLFTMPPDIHLKARKKLRHLFNFSCLPDFHPRMLDAIDEFIQDLTLTAEKVPRDQFSQPIDLSLQMSVLTFRVITNVAFGTELSRVERLKFASDVDSFLDGLFTEMMGFCYRWLFKPGDMRKHLVDNKQVVSHMCENIIQQRLNEGDEQKRSRHADVLDAILEMEQNSIQSATSQVLVFALGGAHTVNQSMSWLLFEVLQRPEVLSRIEKEIEDIVGDREESERFTHEDVSKLCYLRKVWKETLRIRPPGSLFMRQATQDVELKGSGQKIPKGVQTIAFLDRAHTHEAFWKDAESFRPDRWGTPEHPGEGERAAAGAYVPYSAGPSNCPGQFFGEYEGLLTLAQLLRVFELRLACKPEDVMSSNSWVNVGRYASRGDGFFDMGIPFRVRRRRARHDRLVAGS